jgi:Matrixin
MQRFESILSWTILIGLIGAAAYFFPHEIRTTAFAVYQKISPCSIPLTYKIGTVDPKFGISQKTLQEDLILAAGLWNDAAGKKVIGYDQTNGVIEVHLVYDSRQEMTLRLKALGVQLSNDRATYDQVKEKYDAAFSQFNVQKEAFERHLSAFETKKRVYEQEVAQWNSKGGAPRSEYARLQSEQNALAAASRALSQEQSSLNTLVENVNDLARALNKLIDGLKLDVEKYNDTGSSHGESFEQGLYERTFGKQTITIFEYENNALLTRVLAHEFGHALALDHVEDPDAIMYYLNQGEEIALTDADVVALRSVCRIK